ncbi:hypothetical protein [Oceanobacillus jeddahense]|uniref:Uncharacterized protein n=1 Tax=Oceanobacillus jeddahense TaxID=1462527 RepID=A0ABY5JXW2_9BACI|nr:hypothetical protein [Oceanobacillus jeddahense]UUI04906.1 hypothetical protein NP439_09830 [Oceanobacillus jeddahense]
MELIGILITAGIVYFLYKKGVIKNIRFPVIKVGFVTNHLKNKQLRIRYKKFNGISNHIFVVGTNQNVHFDYDVVVEEGSLELIFRQRRDVVFHKEFHQSEKGSFSFTSSRKNCMLLVTGKHTKGSCQVALDRADEEIAN